MYALRSFFESNVFSQGKTIHSLFSAINTEFHHLGLHLLNNSKNIAPNFADAKIRAKIFGKEKGIFWKGKSSVDTISLNKNFNYLKNHKLEKFIEKEEYIELKILNILDKKISSIYCKKLFYK